MAIAGNGGIKLKRIVIILALLCLTQITYNAYTDQSEYYVKTVPVYKVYIHKSGYIVTYESETLKGHNLFIPYKWMAETNENGQKKAVEIDGNDPSFPYIDIYWKNGQFSHIKLFLKSSKQDPSWGILSDPDKFNDKFTDEAPASFNFN